MGGKRAEKLNVVCAACVQPSSFTTKLKPAAEWEHGFGYLRSLQRQQKPSGVFWIPPWGAAALTDNIGGGAPSALIRNPRKRTCRGGGRVLTSRGRQRRFRLLQGRVQAVMAHD